MQKGRVSDLLTHVSSPLSRLPAESFFPFPVIRVPNAEVLWKSPDFHGQLDLSDYAFVTLGDTQSEPKGDIGIALAERYGGAGVGSNGGGVRCGLVENVQIKGVGRNPLAGVTTDRWHRHGAASVQDCIKEAIWSTILGSALPFGATASLGIIDLKETFTATIEETSEDIQVPRALLIRQPGLRLAHFLRSSFIDTGDWRTDQQLDVARTRSALMALERSAVDLGFQACEFHLFIKEMLERAAAQLARARALRIVHGSLIPSNYCVTGEWLDFGTATMTAGYSQVFVAPGSDSSWNQHRPILEAVEDLCVYWSKYTGKFSRPESAEVSSELAKHFSKCFQEFSISEFILLSGLSPGQVSCAPSRQKQAFIRAMFELLEAEDRNPYLYYGDRRHAMRLPKPNVDLNRLLRVASTSVAMSEAANRLEGEGSLGRRENSLLQAYFDLRANVYGKEPRLAATIRCLALNQSARTLYRDDLDNVIDKHVRTKGDCVDLVNTISAHWAGALRYSPDGSMCLKGWLTRDNFYLDDELGVSIGGQQVGPTEVLNDVCSTALNDTHQLARALKDIAQ